MYATGPSYYFASTLGDSCHGGQIVMSDTVYARIHASGSLENSSVVFNHLGKYQFTASHGGIETDPVHSVYEVQP